jgi:hypothetical protein
VVCKGIPRVMHKIFLISTLLWYLARATTARPLLYADKFGDPRQRQQAILRATKSPVFFHRSAA